MLILTTRIIINKKAEYKMFLYYYNYFSYFLRYLKLLVQ